MVKNLKKNLPFYLGFSGLFLIIFAQVTNFLEIKPIVYWYIAILWYGYIFLVDSIVFILSGNSYIIRKTKKFITMAILSVFFWLIFEFYNLLLKGWYYVGTPTEPGKCIPCYFAVSTILPAIFESAELIKGLRIFRKVKMERIKINLAFLYLSIFIGLVMIILPFFHRSPYMWALVWIGFIFLLDPVNHLFHEKSLISQIRSGKLTVILSFFAAGYLCGFLWELWNYRAYTKWYYTVPILNEIKIFEIPFLGFFAYGFFALELYVMYYFAKLLIPRRLESELGLR